MSDVPTRFYLIVNAHTREVLASVEERAGDPYETAKREARRNPDAVIVVMEPKEAFRAGERPVERVYLEWPVRADAADNAGGVVLDEPPAPPPDRMIERGTGL